MARRRGMVAGPLLMLLGAWGALIPFFGHSFGYGYTPDNTWSWTAARGWLEVLPGIGAFLGGALLTVTAHRALALFGSWVAALSGAWFVVGTVITPWWNPGFIGTPSGDAHHGVWEQLGMFTGIGLVVLLLAAIAIGRATVFGIRDLPGGQRQLDALRRIEESPPVAEDDVLPHIDLNAAEAERLAHTSARDRSS
jgi:hypothetical protein